MGRTSGGERVQFPWPRQGWNQDRAAAEQPPQTSGRARNVRYLDPETRRSRGAQRAGMSRFWSNDLDAGVDHLASISINAPKIEYAQLPSPQGEWSRDVAEGFSVACRSDRDGTLYTLTSDDRVLVTNPDGEQLESFDVPLRSNEVVGQSMAVDGARRIYAAAVPAPGTEAGTGVSRVFQWRRVQDPDDERLLYYDLAWTIEVDGNVGPMEAVAGGLWLVRGDLGGATVQELTKYGALSATQPILEWSRPVPAPCNGIAIGPTGGVYIAVGANPNRAANPELDGLQPSVKRLTPHDLGYNGTATEPSTTKADRRFHAWVDTRDLPGFSDGAEVTYISDRRYQDTREDSPANGQPGGSSDNPAEYGQGPFDNTVRALRRDDSTRHGPIARPGAWVGRACVEFDRTFDPGGTGFPGQAIKSAANLSGAFKQLGAVSSRGIETTDQNFVTTTSFADIADSGGALTFTPGMTPQTNVGIQCRLLISAPTALTLELRTTYNNTPHPQIVQTVVGPTGLVVIDLPAQSSPAAGATYRVQARTRPNFSNHVITLLTASALELFTQSQLPSDDAAMPSQPALVPGHATGIDGPGDNYTHFSVWDMRDDASGPQIMACQNGNVHKWALLAHTKVVAGSGGSPGVLTHAPGWVTFTSNQMYEGDSELIEIGGNFPQNYSNWRAISQDARTTTNELGDRVLVTVGIAGTTNSNALDVNRLQSYFRVNGTAGGKFSMRFMEAHGSGSYVLIGNKHVGNLPSPEDLFDASVPFLPFAGLFASWVTMLGSTSTLANDVATTAPIDNSTNQPPQSGENSGSLDPADYNSDTPDINGSYTGRATEVERIEGGLMHEWGIPFLFPNSGTPAQDGTSLLWDNHPFASGRFPTGFFESSPITDTDQALTSPRPILAKVSSGGSGFIWAVNGSGLGYGVAADEGGRHVVAVGEKDTADTVNPDTVIRRVFDGGNTFSLDTTDGAWVYDEPAFTPSFERAVVVTDSEGNAYWARNEDDSVVKHSVVDGTRSFAWTDPAANPDLDIIRSVALDPVVPVYPSTVDQDDQTPLFFYAAGISLRKVRMVSETQVIGATEGPRQTRYIATSGVNVWGGPGLDDAGMPQAAAILTGGSGVLDPERTYVSSAPLFGKLYITDGNNYLVYDPVKDEVEPFVSKSRGEPPKRARLMASYNGRLVMARTQDSDTAWFMSAQGDPEDWDYFPPEPSVRDAVNGESERGPGLVADAITALVTFDDSTLIIGCDSSILVMRGDPLGGMRLDSMQGGRIDVLTDQTGMAFGRSTARGPSGEVYFFGQRGGVYRMTSTEVRRISDYTIERTLQDIDLSEYRVELAWDYRNEGLHIFQIEHTASETDEGFQVTITKTWTTEADFDEGTYDTTESVAVGDGAVALLTTSGTHTKFFLPLGSPPDDGSVVRIDPGTTTPGTAAVVGRYRTAPQENFPQPGMATNPSRVVIDDQGNCWVGNRAENLLGTRGSVAKIGYVDGGTRVDQDQTPNPDGLYVLNPTRSTAVDRDGDGLIRTSRGFAQWEAWPNVTDGTAGQQGAPGSSNPGTVNDAVDECVLLYKWTTAANLRQVTPDGEGAVFTCGFSTGFPSISTGIDKIDEDTGAGLGQFILNSCGGYNGDIEGGTTLFSVGRDQNALLAYDTDTVSQQTYSTLAMVSPTDCVVTGDNYVLVIGEDSGGGNPARIQRRATATPGVITTSYGLGAANSGTGIIGVGSCTAIALASEDASDYFVWITDVDKNMAWNLRLSKAGAVIQVLGVVEFSTTTPTGTWPTGVGFDSDGYVWVPFEQSQYVLKINPSTYAVTDSVDTQLGFPNIESPKGFMRTFTSGNTLSPGTWTAKYDSANEDLQWSTISWTLAQEDPETGTFLVEVRASNTEAGLTFEPWTAVEDGQSIGLAGQWLEVRCTFTKARNHPQEGTIDAGPVLYDLTVTGFTLELPGPASSYFWDSHSGGWYEDTYAAPEVQPTAVAVFDGDRPDDRVVALGMGNGIVRYVDQTAATDDGVEIAGDLWIGPLMGQLPDAEYRWSQLQVVLARDSGPVDFEWYGRTEPDINFDSPGTADATGTFLAGINPVNYKRARGLYVWLRLRSPSGGTRWAYEAGSMIGAPGGRARQRTGL